MITFLTISQVYEGLVYMDFDKDLIDKQGYGKELNCFPCNFNSVDLNNENH